MKYVLLTIAFVLFTPLDWLHAAALSKMPNIVFLLADDTLLDHRHKDQCE